MQTSRLLSILTVASIAAMASWAQGAEDAKPLLSLADVFELEYASDPRISPDGETIVYIRNFMDIMTDTRRSNLWTVRFDGTRHRPFTSGLGGYGSPRCLNSPLGPQRCWPKQPLVVPTRR